jgi:hypothetical protein
MVSGARSPRVVSQFEFQDWDGKGNDKFRASECGSCRSQIKLIDYLIGTLRLRTSETVLHLL